MKLTRSVYEAMLGAARKAAPLEACGLLAGTGKRAIQCYVLTNADAAAEHFSILPEEQFAAIEEMRRKTLRMIAIWHSHPTTPAQMSAEDLRLAYTPDVLYVIVSLAEPGRPRVGVFEVRDGLAHEHPLSIEEEDTS